MDSFPRVQTAVIQAAPSLFNRDASVEKARRLTAEAAAQGAWLILFPEAFIPAHPRGLSFGAVVGSRSANGRLVWQRYWANAYLASSSATINSAAAHSTAPSSTSGLMEHWGIVLI